MLSPPGRRSFPPRPRARTVLLIALASLIAYHVLFSGSSPRLHIVPYLREPTASRDQSGPGSGRTASDPAAKPSAGTKAEWEIDIEDLRSWSDPDDQEDPNDTLPGYEGDGIERDHGSIGRLQHEKDLRKMWRYAYKTTAK